MISDCKNKKSTIINLLILCIEHQRVFASDRSEMWIQNVERGCEWGPATVYTSYWFDSSRPDDSAYSQFWLFAEWQLQLLEAMATV
jgi:hypothetical protein